MRFPSNTELKGEAFLLTAAFLWGGSFVLQRLAMKTMGPFGFNAARYFLAVLSVLPVLVFSRLRGRRRAVEGLAASPENRAPLLRSLLIGAGSGAIMFGGASLQQIGIVDTTAGKAGFISGLYIVFVPIFSLFLRKPSGLSAWLGAAVAAAGLYFLSMAEGLAMGRGDMFVLCGAALWAAQILYLDRFASRSDPFALAAAQFAVVAALSLPPALLLERTGATALRGTLLPVAASGVFAVGLGFTCQILGQRKAQASRASLVMSLESPFAAVAGAVFLGELITPRMLLGFGLIMGGVILSQAGKSKT